MNVLLINMSWQILIAISILLYSIAMILLRIIAKENQKEPISYAIISQIIVGSIIGLIGLVSSDMRLPNLLDYTLPLIITCLLYAGASVFMFSSLQRTEASRFTVILATRAFFTILAATLLLNESLSSKQFMGAIFIFTGVILVNFQAKKFQIGKGELFALLAAMCFGLANVGDRYLTQHFNLYPYLTLTFIMPAVILALLFPKSVPKISLFFQKKTFGKTALVNCIYAISAITFFAALQKGESASQVVTVNITNIIVIVILSIIFLHERDNMWKKLLGAGVSFIGLLLIG